MAKTGRTRTVALLSGGALVALAIAGCGSSGTFKNQPRPPVPIQLTGVVTDRQVTVSPDHVGGGPVRLLVANESQQAHTIVLERSGNQGSPTRDVVGPVNPASSATLQQDLTPGQYSVTVDSTPNSIQPASIVVGPERRSSSGSLLLP